MNLTDRLITAIMEKCDGLSITAEQASNILAYLQYGAPLARQPAAIGKEPVAEVVMEPFDTWPRLKFVSVESMRNVEAGDMLYAAPPAQTAIADDARDAARYRWLRKEHFPTAENPPLAQVVWKAFDNRHSSDWANMIDGNDLDRAIDAALTAAQSASGDTKP